MDMERPRDSSGRGDGGRSMGEGGLRIGVRSISGLMAGLTSMSSKETGLDMSFNFVLPSLSRPFSFRRIPFDFGVLFFFLTTPPPSLLGCTSALTAPLPAFTPLFLFFRTPLFRFLFFPTGLFIAGELSRSGEGVMVLVESRRSQSLFTLRGTGLTDLDIDRDIDLPSCDCGVRESLYDSGGDGSDGVLGRPFFLLLNTGVDDLDLSEKCSGEGLRLKRYE